LLPGAPPSDAPQGAELHLRLIDLRQARGAEGALRCFLSPDEIARASRFHFDVDRSRFVLTRGWLRVMLARCLAVTPEQLLFSYGRHGKPELAQQHKDSALSFNVSHSRDYALIGLTMGRAIGVDIEQVRPMPDFEGIATEYFSTAERRALFAFPEGDRLRAFFRCWTRKEAFMKATGEGMGTALDGFSVGLGEGEESRISMLDSSTGASGEWTVNGLALTPDCEAAIAVAGSGVRVSAWRDPVSLE
jgi:4'-phosphopantetheinyl transferase